MTCSPLAFLLAVALLCTGNAFSATPEYEVKAAHVFNFAKFFEWPNAATPITVCMYGKDPFEGFLDDVVRNKLVHGLPVTIRHLLKEQEILDDCQMLFIGVTSRVKAEAALVRAEGRSIVTISEADSFLEDGGMVRLLVDESRVRFDINLVAIAAAQIKVNARLVVLGRTVRK